MCAEKIAGLEKSIRADAAEGEATTRLLAMPMIGPSSAMAIEAFAPAIHKVRRGRDFAAWVGLVPRRMSTGGKQNLGRTLKMGRRDIRRLLTKGAMAAVRASVRKLPSEGG